MKTKQKKAGQSAEPEAYDHKKKGPAAKIDSLKITFAGKPIISIPQLTLQHHQTHILSGPSGSGKSTFLRALNRLNECLPRSHSQGSIRLSLDGQEMNILKLKASQLPYLRRKVAMVFQSPNVLPLSIEKNLSLPLQISQSVRAKDATAMIRSTLQRTHLWKEVHDRLQQPATTLSGGQQQRLCLARALILNPEFLLLDEPTSSLDPEGTAQIEALIKELSQDYTIVMVSHSRRQIAKLADSHLVCQHGKVTFTD